MSLPEAVLTLTEGQNFQQQVSPQVPEPVRQAAPQTVPPVVVQMPPLVVEQAPIPQWTNLPSSGAQAAANRAPVPSAQVQEKPVFQLPERAANFKRVFAYLCKERAIEPAVVKEMIAQQCLYESVKHLDNGNEIHNACFVSHDPDGNPCAAFQRSLYDSGNPFKRDVLGSNKDYGWLLRGAPGAVAVFEASIDAASWASFCVQNNAAYPDLLALGGLNSTPLENYLQTHPETTTVMLGLDVDNAGRAATQRFLTMLKKRGVQAWDISEGSVLHGKDWNAELKWHRQREQKIQAVQQSQTRQSQGQQPPLQNQTAPQTPSGTFSVYRLNDQRDIQPVCQSGKVKPKQYHRIHTEPLYPGDAIQSVGRRIINDKLPSNYKSLPLIRSDLVVMHQNGGSSAYLFTPQGFQERPELLKVESQQPIRSAPQPENMMEM